MFNISATLQCLASQLDKKSLRQLSLIAQAMLAMTGRVILGEPRTWPLAVDGKGCELPDHPALFQHPTAVVRTSLVSIAQSPDERG